MTLIPTTKNNFTSGEVSPSLLGRSDTSAYQNGATLMRNVYVDVTGGVSRRPGLRYVATLPGDGRMVAFTYNATLHYLLVFTDFKMNVYRDGVHKLTEATPYSLSDLADLQWIQKNDQLLFVHPHHEPRYLERLSDIDFDLVPWVYQTVNDFYQQPYANFTDGTITLTPSATTGAITLTASADVFDADHVSVRFRLHGGEVEVTGFTSATSVSATVKVILAATTATKTWEEAAYSAVRGWPKSVSFYQDRLVIGGSRDLESRLWFSKTSDYFNFDLGTGLDDEAIEFNVLSDHEHHIQTILNGRYLQILTSAGEWMVMGDPLTPASIQLKLQTLIGSYTKRYVPPRIVEGATMFVSRSGEDVRELLYAEAEQSYQATDLALLSKHLMRGPLDQDYDSQKRLLYFVMDDGTMAVMTSDRLRSMTAWAQYNTAGSFRSVCVVDGAVYVLCERGSSYFVEVFDTSYLVDSGLLVSSGTPSATFSGFAHLANKTVRILADDILQPDQSVSPTGVIALPYLVSTVRAGLAYTHTVAPLPPVVGDQQFPKMVRLVEACFRLRDTQALEVDVGRGVQFLSFQKFGDVLSPLDVELPLYTGDARVRAVGWNRDFTIPLWKIQSDLPFACHVLSVSTNIKVNS